MLLNFFTLCYFSVVYECFLSHFFSLVEEFLDRNLVIVPNGIDDKTDR